MDHPGPALPGSDSAIPEPVAATPAGSQPTAPGTSALPRPAFADSAEETIKNLLEHRRQAQESPDRRAKLRRSLELRYAELGKALDLAPEELDRILDMMVRRQMDYDSESLELISRSPLDVATQEELRRRSRLMGQAREEEVRAVLGDKYDKWAAYKLTPGVRTSVIRFQDVFGPDADPLSEEQNESLVAALAAEQVRINRDMSGVLPTQAYDLKSRLQGELDWALRYTPENNRRLVIAATPYLNPRQLADYRQMLEDDMNESVASLRTQIAQQKISVATFRLFPAD